MDTILIGSSIPPGLQELDLHRRLKLGNIVLTRLPEDKAQALAVARFCRKNKIFLCFSELLWRGTVDLCWAFRKQILRPAFYSKEDLEEIIDAAGDYYFGRITIGECGGVLYWPKAYTLNRRAENWENLPACRTVDQAQSAYIAYCKKWLDFERSELGKGPLLNVESSMACKYQVKAGMDTLCLELLPGDPHLMVAATRGTAKAFSKPWGTHIALEWYGGVCFDELLQKRWRTSVFFSYLSGADFIYPESGHYTYTNQARNQRFGFHSNETQGIRRTLREAWQFSSIHKRPPHGPKVSMAVVHGQYEGYPGLWNRYVWGQYDDEKWREGPSERSWTLVDKFFRKEEWSGETVQGRNDFSGNPPFGQYDVVPIEAPPDVLGGYSCLVFLGWNTMTESVYEKLKTYVANGGHLIMFLPHLSTRVDRAEALELYSGGDFSDLFGAVVKGKETTAVQGVKCLTNSSLPAYRFPLWRINTDPRFIGNITPAVVELTTARVISGFSDYYETTEEELLQRPAIIENRIKKGTAFLVTAWEYPGDDGLRPLAEDILRTVLQGEQTDIRLLGSDRIRYAVYEGRLPKDRKKFQVVYLLNTDPDSDSLGRLRIRGKTTGNIYLTAGDLRLAYICKDLVILPEDKMVDLYNWKVGNRTTAIELFSVRRRNIKIYNLGKHSLRVMLNGMSCSLNPGEEKTLTIKRRVDPGRKSFFDPDFSKEPSTRYTPGEMPY
jgi:hypothetical protein